MTDAGRLTLGTAQWGLDYGVANRTGRATSEAVAAMLSTARDAGVATLDTARAYGGAEAVIGALADSRWRVITKLAPDVAGPSRSRAEARGLAEASLDASRAALRREQLDAVLLHRAEQRRASGGAAWDVLRSGREAGRIGAIGISVVRVEDAPEAIDDPGVEIVQVPASLLDRRLASAGFFDHARQRTEVFVRSVFLQGVAHLPADSLPSHLRSLAPVLGNLDRLAAEVDATRADLFLAWARLRLPDARVVIGCETAAQLETNLDSWTRIELDEVVPAAEELVPDLPDELLDPWRWEGRPPRTPRGSDRPPRH